MQIVLTLLGKVESYNLYPPLAGNLVFQHHMTTPEIDINHDMSYTIININISYLETD